MPSAGCAQAETGRSWARLLRCTRQLGTIRPDGFLRSRWLCCPLVRSRRLPTGLCCRTRTRWFPVIGRAPLLLVMPFSLRRPQCRSECLVHRPCVRFTAVWMCVLHVRRDCLPAAASQA